MKSNRPTNILVLACALLIGCGGNSDPSNVAESAEQSDLEEYRAMQKESQAMFEKGDAFRVQQEKLDSKKKKKK